MAAILKRCVTTLLAGKCKGAKVLALARPESKHRLKTRHSYRAVFADDRESVSTTGKK